MCHCLAGDDAVALAPGGADDDGRAVVVVPEFRRRHEPERIRNDVAQRPVADDHSRDAFRRKHQLLDSFLRGQPPDVEDVRRIGGLCERFG